MASVLVPLAPGCEELEAVTIIDLLRRAGIEVVTAGLDEGLVKCSRGVVLLPDAVLDDEGGEIVHGQDGEALDVATHLEGIGVEYGHDAEAVPLELG